MEPRILIGSANRPLGEAIARELGVAPTPCIAERFPDGEIRVEIGAGLAGADVFVVQPTAPPVDDTLLELLLLGDAAARAGAARLVAVVPYVGYARSDRRTRDGQPLAAKLVASLFDRAGFERVIAVDLHSPPIEGFFSMPVDHLDPIDVLAARLEDALPEHAVVVSPDLGGAKRADALGHRWKLPVAIVHKQRTSGSAVTVHGVAGDVRGLSPILVDDMISTGGTLVAAMEALRMHGAVGGPIVVATHALCVGDAIARLSAIGVSTFIASDTLQPPRDAPFPVITATVAPLLAAAIGRVVAGS